MHQQIRIEDDGNGGVRIYDGGQGMSKEEREAFISLGQSPSGARSLAELLADPTFLLQHDGDNDHRTYHRILSTLVDEVGIGVYNRLFFAIGVSKILEWKARFPRSRCAQRAFTHCAQYIHESGLFSHLQPPANAEHHQLSRMGTSSEGPFLPSVMMGNAVEACFATQFTTRGLIVLHQFDKDINVVLAKVREILEEIDGGVDHTLPFRAKKV